LRWHEKDRENFVSRLGRFAAETDTGIFAWALMTNHAHILIKSELFGLPNFMRRLLTGHAITYNLRHRR
jgi:REP element-mobilizing transposase RayT